MGDKWVLEQADLDFAELDPVAVDLDLIVESAQEFVVAVGLGRRQHLVAGSVAAVAADGDESIRGQIGTSEIALAQRNSADVQLAGRLRAHDVVAELVDRFP